MQRSVEIERSSVNGILLKMSTLNLDFSKCNGKRNDKNKGSK